MKTHIRYDITPSAEKKLKEYAERVGKKEIRLLVEFVRDLPETTQVSANPGFSVQRFDEGRIYKGGFIEKKLLDKLNAYAKKVHKSRDLVIEEFIQGLH